MKKASEKLALINQLMSQLEKKYPAETNAFMSFMKKTEAGPALGGKENELINVALSVAAQCEWCIALHVKQAIGVGATRDEIIEAGYLAVLMHGGPALMYLIYVVEALDEFLPDGEDD